MKNDIIIKKSSLFPNTIYITNSSSASHCFCHMHLGTDGIKPNNKIDGIDEI